jgi:hypothetical protein
MEPSTTSWRPGLVLATLTALGAGIPVGFLGHDAWVGPSRTDRAAMPGQQLEPSPEAREALRMQAAILSEIEALARRPDSTSFVPSERQMEVPDQAPVEREALDSLASLVERARAELARFDAAQPAVSAFELLGRSLQDSQVTLEELAAARPAERKQRMQWKTYAEVLRELGPPARIILGGGGSFLWEYDLGGKALLGMRFREGRVMDAWN